MVFKIKPEYLNANVLKNVKVTSNIFNLTLEGNFSGKPGQFYMLKGWDNELLLGRPISIHSLNENTLEFLYKAEGKGTKILSYLKEGDSVEIMGPLGNGFDLDKIKGKVAIVAGGIGVAPMRYLLESLKVDTLDAYLGFRDEVYGVDVIEDKVDNIYIATEDGSKGHKGYVTEIFKPEKYDLVLCCGPEIMMEKIIKMARDKKVPIYVSMEKRMACGVGACLVCTCKTRFGNKRTCKDGPVFNGEDIILKGDI